MTKDWTNIFEKYKGLWVALEEDGKTVIASGVTVNDVVKKAQTIGRQSPIVMRVPTRIVPYIGGLAI